MKKILICSVVLCMAVFYGAAQTGTKKTVKEPAKAAVKTKGPEMKNLLDSFSYAAGFNVATNMKTQGINKVNVAIMQKAIDDVFKNITPALNAEAANACLQKQLQLFSAEKNAEEKVKGVAFLEANKKRKEVTTLPDGLQYEVIKSGDVNGVHPKPADTVEVNYVGTTIDGKEFDNSFKRGQVAAFPLMSVIKGWTEILQLMKPGDHWKVYVPSELGYDVNGNGPAIPPNATLIFEIALEKIRAAVISETPKSGQ